jgi:predicted glutamine amidotransferase
MAVLDNTRWDRMFLHCRFATQGDPTLDNTHGWANNGVFFMHNGVLMNPEAYRYNVDSQLIGGWLFDGVDHTLEQLQKESYANVFLIDTNSGYYCVSRSEVGTLFTDWQGNYSSNPVGRIRVPVPNFSTNSYWYAQPDEMVFETATEGL